MAVFERDAKRKPGTRSNTKLVVSGGFSPAEMFQTDKDLPILFNYDYGGPGQKEVVISKGMVVGVKPQAQVHYETNKTRTVLTIANDSAPIVGMAPYNFTKHNDDFLDGNQPAIITREYVELPYIPNADDAAAMKYGAIHGAGLNIGDLVTYSRDVNNFGKLVKWQEGTHSIASIAGQVLGLETDQEPLGWLKWALWDEAARRQDDGPDKTGYKAPPENGFPYDPEYLEGVNDVDGYLSPYTTNPTGIPGILDGSQKAQTLQTKNFTVLTGTTATTKIAVDLGLQNIVDGSVTVYDGTGGVVDASNYTVDLKKGQLVYTVPADTTADETFQVQFRAHFFGTPAGMDFKGVRGAARLLLKF